ncbi:Lrp/AsnC family transcriptional regulator [Candidatus Woesearchaeota archaeon]|nr:Lrp/AsnC family transcriptional regulator [Candidatus Woesearchaeota archaeon]
MLKHKDLLILSQLRQNARQSLTVMSRRIFVPVTTIHDNIKKYEKTFVRKYATLLDFKKLGFGSRAHIALRSNPEQREKLEDFLLKSNHVNSLYKLNSGFDFLIEIISENSERIEEFVKDLENEFDVQETVLFDVEEELRREDFLSQNKLEKFHY